MITKKDLFDLGMAVGTIQRIYEKLPIKRKESTMYDKLLMGLLAFASDVVDFPIEEKSDVKNP